MVLGAAGVAFSRKEGLGLLISYLSRLIHTARRARCLRFAAQVTPRPRKTRFSGADQASGAGLATRRVPSRTFALASQFMLPPPRLAWRNLADVERDAASSSPQLPCQVAIVCLDGCHDRPQPPQDVRNRGVDA